MPDNEQGFGSFLKEQISRAKMTQSAFYTAVGITKPYFYDILSGKTKPPPLEIQYRMITVLEKKKGKNKESRDAFLNMAAKGRQEIPVDIIELVKAHPEKWDIIREALNRLF